MATNQYAPPSDTDSLIYAFPRGQNPLRTGGHLGELSDECPDHHIVEFCSAGPKQYGVKLLPKAKAQGPTPTPTEDNNNPSDDNNTASPEPRFILKIKGFTLNWDAVHNQGLQYRNFRKRVYRYARTGLAESKQIQLHRQFQPLIAEGRVYCREGVKTQRPYFCKGILTPQEMRILDFGHLEEPEDPGPENSPLPTTI